MVMKYKKINSFHNNCILDKKKFKVSRKNNDKVTNDDMCMFKI